MFIAPGKPWLQAKSPMRLSSTGDAQSTVPGGLPLAYTSPTQSAVDFSDICGENIAKRSAVRSETRKQSIALSWAVGQDLHQDISDALNDLGGNLQDVFVAFFRRDFSQPLPASCRHPSKQFLF
jgi:hypothetical protein